MILVLPTGLLGVLEIESIGATESEPQALKRGWFYRA
jgi:hypothetical protein